VIIDRDADEPPPDVGDDLMVDGVKKSGNSRRRRNDKGSKDHRQFGV
jgi:hypothetical protein